VYSFLSLPIPLPKIDNSAKLAAHGTEDEDRQTKNATQNLLDTSMNKQTQIT
jgi:hypothetical protein